MLNQYPGTSLLKVVLLGIAGLAFLAGPKRIAAQPDGRNSEQDGRILFSGGTLVGAGNWSSLRAGDIYAVNTLGQRYGLLVQKGRLYLSGRIQTTTSKFRMSGLERSTSQELQKLLGKVQMPFLQAGGRALVTLLRGSAGGVGLGLSAERMEHELEVDPSTTDQEDPPSIRLSSVTRVGGLIAYHTPTDSPFRLILSAQGGIDRQTTETEAPFPSPLARVGAHLRLDWRLSSRLSARVRGEVETWPGGPFRTSDAYGGEGESTGRLIGGRRWEGAARLHLRLTEHIEVYAGVNGLRRSQLVRYRVRTEGSISSETDQVFLSSLNGSVGLGFSL